MNITENFGILASIAWNSTGWAAEPTPLDLQKTTAYNHIKSEQHAHESLNFGHEIYPKEKDGSYIGYTPMFSRLMPDKQKSRQVKVIFFLSSDYARANRKCIVGLYAFPEFGWFERKARHRLFGKYDGGNVKAAVGHVLYLEQPVVIDEDSVVTKNLLPAGKQIGKRGFNYLHSDNVAAFLRLAEQAATSSAGKQKVRQLVAELWPDGPEADEAEEEAGPAELQAVLKNQEADTAEGIRRLEEKMQKLRPQLKKRVSLFIERGAIATKVKQLTGYKCQLCAAMGLNPIGFLKANGTPYIETHHVEPVSGLGVGVLSVANLVTLCATHHRQMHYGNVTLKSQNKQRFTFVVDGKARVLNKIKV